MTTSLTISSDGKAIALACTSLALEGDRSIKPLTPKEWHRVSLALQSSDLERPNELVDLSPGELQDSLSLDTPTADRLAALLSRGGQLAFELERLAGRGIWVLTRADEDYPALLKKRLRSQSPPVLFGAGPRAAFQRSAIAVVGSRDVDEAGLAWAANFGKYCADADMAVVSGAARGVDITAMAGSLEHGGTAIGVTVDPLERLVRRREFRELISDELLTLITPFHPSARWHAGNAMRRNRLIYALSRAAVVVASSLEKGGTRSGALENLKAGWVTLHVRDDGSPGNNRLIAEGGHRLQADALEDELDLGRLLIDPRPTLLEAAEDTGPAQRPGISGTNGHAEDPPPSRTNDVGKPEPEAGAAPVTPLVPTDSSTDAFRLIWPELSRQLVKPLTEREVADRLSLQLTQARAWLGRAVDEGLAEVKQRPKKRYMLRDPEVQLRIDA